ncbi:MAG TPA: DUF1488 family protein [Burkholderiaceae bacterium]|nr:DUF1488 family protein [Burkholderiaceae bacterium]
MDGNARVSRVLEGIDFAVTIQGEKIRAFVAAETLCEQFGADGTEMSWLLAYARHRAEIAAALDRARKRTMVRPLILLDEDFRPNAAAGGKSDCGP